MVQFPKQRIPCPDCPPGTTIPADKFVAHREQEHPPTTAKTLAPGGIESQEGVGAQ